MAVGQYIGYFALFLMLMISSFNSFNSYGTDNTSVNFDKTRLEGLFAEYVNWNVNLPTAQLPEEGNQCLVKPGDVNFLLDPFSKGTVVQTCDIKKDTSLLFPFYEGWCDNGNHDLYGNQDYKKILDCTLDSDKGIVTMTAWWDGNKVVDIKVNNKDVYNLKVMSDSFPQNQFYKVILTPSFFNLTVTNASRFATTTYEKPDDFQSSPAIYKSVGHCFCGLITNITAGDHELRYKTMIEGTGGVAEGKGWDQETEVTYKLKVN
jgi:hypothetical protein